MSGPTITEIKPPYAARWGADGLIAARRWQVIAVSQANALIIMQNGGVRRFIQYQDRFNNIPDPFCCCQTIECDEGKPPGSGPTNAPQTGLYTVTADYARTPRNGTLGPTPGQPAVWTIERSEITAPIDRDANGYPINNRADEPINGVTQLRASEVLVARWYTIAPGPYGDVTLYSQFRQYAEKVNSASFWGAPRGCFFHKGTNPSLVSQSLYLLEARWEYRPPQSPPGIGAFYTRSGGGTGQWQSITAPIEGWAEVKINAATRKVNPSWTGSPGDTNLKYLPLSVTEPTAVNAAGDLLGSSDTPIGLVFYRQFYIDFTTMPIPGGVSS